MAKKLGNNYRLYIQSATPGTYNVIAGQQDLSYDRKSNQIDTSDKNNAPYGTSAAGLFDISVKLDGIADLPDANGFTRAETLFKAQTAEKFQIRKTPFGNSDQIFECVCNMVEFSINYGQNDVVKYSLGLAPDSAPTVDALS